LYNYLFIFIVITVIVPPPPQLCISGQVSAPDVGLSVPVPVKITYLLDNSEPAQWQITIPTGINLMGYSILFPMCLSPLQFIIADSGTYFGGIFNSVATVTRNDTSFTLNITGSGLTMDGNLLTVTFDAIAYGDFNLTSYTYDLSAVSFTYNVDEDDPGRVLLSTFIEDDLPLFVMFEYSPKGNEQRPFDSQEFTIDQSAVFEEDMKLVFSATSLLEPRVLPQTICAIGNLTAQGIPLSSVKAAQVVEDEEDHPVFWEINIPSDATPEEYARILPLLVLPVSLAFSSDVLDVIDDTFVTRMTLTTGRRTLTLTFTSNGIVNSTVMDNVEVLSFNAVGTGRLRSSYTRSFASDTFTMSFREEIAGNLIGAGDVGNFKIKLNLQYDNKTADLRFTDVRLIINHTALTTTDNTMKFSVSSELIGWNSSCPVGTGGFRCYSCLRGYYGRPRSGIPCKKCMCNKHSDNCHRRTGRCFRCADNTIGRHCQYCADRYYGNATNGGICSRK